VALKHQKIKSNLEIINSTREAGKMREESVNNV
jgi:hypothetical protein